MHIVIDNKASQMTMPESTKSIVVDSNPQRRVLVKELLNNMGFSTIECSDRLATIPFSYGDDQYENAVLVLYVDAVTNQSMKQLEEFLKHKPMPVLMLAADIPKDSLTSAMKAGVSAFLSLDIKSNRVKQAMHSAVANFERINELQDLIRTGEERLKNRITIDKAKGLVMKSKDLDEAQAYDYLRKYAMKHGKKLIEVAEMTITTAELFNKEA